VSAHLTTLFLLVLIALLKSLNAKDGQEPPIHFDHLTPRDGLTHMVVFDILEDREGFIWFATQLGIDRYNGYNIKNYQNLPNDSNSISNSIVTGLLQDEEGNIWIGTTDGLNRLEPVTQRITRYKPEDVETLNIWCMAQDSTGNLWLGTLGQGLFMFQPQTETFTHFVHEPENPHSLSHNIVRALAVDAEGSLWVGTLGGLDRLLLNPFPTDSTQSEFLHYRHDPADPGTISSDAIESLYVDREGVLWVGTSGGGLNMLRG
jgi:ligand-binding sensor domain-containing protein